MEGSILLRDTKEAWWCLWELNALCISQGAECVHVANEENSKNFCQVFTLTFTDFKDNIKASEQPAKIQWPTAWSTSCKVNF